MSTIPLLPWFPAFNPSSAGVNPAYLITAASSLRLGHHLLSRRCSGHLHRFLLHCFRYQDSYHSGKLPRFTDIWCQSSDLLRHSLLDTFAETFSVAHSACFSFFSGNGKGSGNTNVRWGNSHSNPKRNSLDGRLWTSVLLAFNIMVYVAQVASQGRLILWGAKVNNLIDQGQLWRLATSSFLHANIGHLLVNSYSLNSIGPTVEKLTGARRFLAVYFASAIASSVMSYRCCQSPAVGASGAIFGLVGAYAVFVLRHRSLIGGGKSDIQDIARMIALNMTIGLLSNGIDNWGHLGGLLGGAAMAWFLGPAWRYDSRTTDGRSVFVDRAPIFSFLNRRRLQ